MAHEITPTDGLVLTKHSAWHGLGTIVEEAPSPTEALKIAHLDWEVELWPHIAHSPHEGDDSTAITDRFSVVRKDTKTSLGTVGDRYEPYQNRQLADFCEALSREGKAKIESAGSIRGGQKVWFLLRQGSLTIRKLDQLQKYLLCASSHDGTSRVRIIPTSIRVVCRNTLHMALGSTDRDAIKDAVIEMQHSGDVKKKLQQAHEVWEQFAEAERFTVEKINHLAETAATVEDLREFWAKAYQRDYGAIPLKPVTKVEHNRFNKAMESWMSVERRWKNEQALAGATWWNVLNSYTGFMQHDVKVRGANSEARYEKMVDQRLFGTVGNRTSLAFREAVGLAV